MRIYCIGLVSSGKSSFINSIAGGFISIPSLIKETRNITNFSFGKKGNVNNLILLSNFLKNIKDSNKNSTDNIKMINNSNLLMPIPWKLSSDFEIVDFPGFSIDDCNPYDNLLSILEDADIVLFVSDIVSSMTKNYEFSLFEEIKSKIIQQRNKGNYIEYALILNKYDNIDDDDYNSLYAKISSKITDIPIFRYSSHSMLLDSVIINERDIYVPELMLKEFDNKIKKNADSNFIVTKNNNTYSICKNKNVNNDIDFFIEYLKNLSENLMKKKENEFILFFEKRMELLPFEYCFNDVKEGLKLDNFFDIDFESKRISNICEILVKYIIQKTITNKNLVHYYVNFRFILLEITLEYLVKSKHIQLSELLYFLSDKLHLFNFNSLYSLFAYVINNFNHSDVDEKILNYILTNENTFLPTNPIRYNIATLMYEFSNSKSLYQLISDSDKIDTKISKLMKVVNKDSNTIKYIYSISKSFFVLRQNSKIYSGQYYINQFIYNFEYAKIHNLEIPKLNKLLQINPYENQENLIKLANHISF